MADQPPRRLADIDVSAPPRPSATLGNLADTDLAAPPLDDDARMDDVRAAIRGLLIDAINDLAQAELGGNLYATSAVEELTNTYVRLGGDLELPTNDKLREAYAGLSANYANLHRVAADVCDALESVAADDFPPRLQPLIRPLNELGEQVGR